MELIAWFIDVVLHLDRHLVEMVAEYGVWIYAILFAIIFSETGFVVTPFLPGDSLLFTVGHVRRCDLPPTQSRQQQAHRSGCDHQR